MADRDGPRPPSSRSGEIAGEEFLFHLYRGSELLQDNRVHDAKAELEHALALQPSDPKGQDLLGIVYFRLGLYPRAIAIYERLIQMHPEAIEPRINLALSYLKTGQPSQARTLLETVVEQSPSHSRAWGYLGLAFQRLGDYERASYAFAAGGHDGMARRLVDMSSAAGTSLRPAPPAPARAELQRIAGEAFQELDRDPAFRTDEETPYPPSPSNYPTSNYPAYPPIPTYPAPPPTLPGPPPIDSYSSAASLEFSRTRSATEPPAMERRSRGSMSPEGPRSMGTWAATEPGREQIAPPPRLPALSPPSSVPQHRAAMLEAPSSHPRRPLATAPKQAVDLLRESLLVFPRDLRVAVHTSGMVLIQSPHGFATRLSATLSLSYTVGYGTTVLQRRSRGRTSEEALGGPEDPIVEITGKGELVLMAADKQRLAAIQLDDEAIYLREDALVGLDLSVSYENGRLALGDGEGVPMVQLRGAGAVIVSFPERATTIEVTEPRSTAVRAAALVGWLGRLVPRTLLSTEAPGGARGFIAFTGEGMVMVDGR